FRFKRLSSSKTKKYGVDFFKEKYQSVLLTY
ncbi:MAG: hypothetical protein ACI9HU_001340, partial [Colwellia sp.]